MRKVTKVMTTNCISYDSDVSAVGTYTHTHLIGCQVHAPIGLPLQGAVVQGANVLYRYMYMPLEDML